VTVVRRLTTGSALALFAIAAALYLRGAMRANPGIAAARQDLELVHRWSATGRISDLATDPSHLPKPGYLAYLRIALPHAGSDADENRRFLYLNAGWILLGIGAAALALGRRFGPTSASCFLLLVLACMPLRDSADYVASEPVATGLALLVAAGAIDASAGGDRFRTRFLVGAAACVLGLLRPNLGVLLLVALILTGLASPRRRSATAAALGGFLICLLVLAAVGHRVHLPLTPFAGGSSRVLLWGTADYYWKPDVHDWPVGKTPNETRRLQLQKTSARWSAFFENWDDNRTRSLTWRLGHALFSTDEFPSRWLSPRYLRADKLGRSWWWVIATLLCGGAIAAATGGRNDWQLIPIVIVAACVLQGLLFGADPRLALPCLPILMVALSAALSSMRWNGWTAGGALSGAFLALLVVHRVPDVATSDFALVRGPHRQIVQQLPGSAFPDRGASAIHFRLLQEQPCALGLSVLVGDELLLRRDPGDTSPWPAFFAVPLGEQETARARSNGLTLRIVTDGPDSSGDAFVYYPVIPPLLGGYTTVDGSADVPSGFGGQAVGSLPTWVSSPASVRAPRTRVNAGNSVITIRRNAPSTAYIGSKDETEKATA
jgi:hypothetical protein